MLQAIIQDRQDMINTGKQYVGRSNKLLNSCVIGQQLAVDSSKHRQMCMLDFSFVLPHERFRCGCEVKWIKSTISGSVPLVPPRTKEWMSLVKMARRVTCLSSVKHVMHLES